MQGCVGGPRVGALLWDLADGMASVGAGTFCQNIKSTIILITYGIGWPLIPWMPF